MGILAVILFSGILLEASKRNEINTSLAREGLKYKGDIEVKHLLQVLYHDVGIENLKGKMERKYTNLRVSTYYGCHLLRPSDITRFDDPFSPSKFDALVEITGAKSVSWPTKLECCGSPLLGVNDELSLDLTEKKLVDARRCNADFMCVACPYCQIQFDRVQKRLLSRRNSNSRLPSLLYPQLLGLCLGIDRPTLGLSLNELPFDGVEGFLEPETRQEK